MHTPTLHVCGQPASLDQSGILYLNCTSIDEAKDAIAALSAAFEYARSLDAQQIAVRVNGKIVLAPLDQHTWEELLMSQSTNGANQLIWTPADFQQAIWRAEMADESLSVLRMRDSLNCLTTTAKLRFAGVPWTEWIGKHSKAWWPDAEYQRYVETMQRYPGQLIEIDYRAFRMDEGREERRFFTQVRLVRGTDAEWYRINKTLASESVRAV